MTNSSDRSLSRRKWLRLASATSLGSGLLAATGATAESRAPLSATDQNLGARTYNVRDFGAKGDGTALDTAAVQTAIDACNKDQGGTVHVTFPGGGTAEQAAVRDVPKVAGEYYEIGVPPAYALFARNVRGLTLYNVRFEVATDEPRPAVVFDHVKDAAVNGFSVQGNEKAESLLRFIDTSDVMLSNTRVLTPTALFLQVEGAASHGIRIDGGDLSKAAAPLSFKADADKNSVNLRT